MIFMIIYDAHGLRIRARTKSAVDGILHITAFFHYDRTHIPDDVNSYNYDLLTQRVELG